MKVNILFLGKKQTSWIEEGIQEYTKRLSSRLILSFYPFKREEKWLAAIEKERAPIALDPEGTSLSSLEFHRFVQSSFIKYGSSLTFIIGGPEGLPMPVKKVAVATLSLSPLTFTHEMARLLLVEQLYRAFEIEKGTEYHK